MGWQDDMVDFEFAEGRAIVFEGIGQPKQIFLLVVSEDKARIVISIPMM